MMLTLIIALGVTVPVGLMGLAAGWLSERLGADARLRAWVWATAFFASVGAGLAVVLLDPLMVGFSRSVTVSAADPVALQNSVETVRETYAAGAAQIVYAIEESPRTLPIGAAILAAIAVGALIKAGLYAGRMLRLARLAAESTPLGDSALAAQCGMEPDLIRLADCAAPVLAGFRRPLILLPRALRRLKREQLRMICRHELSHFRRGDNIRSVIEYLAGVPLWFNPALAVIRRKLIAVREELADADATAGAGPGERRAYAETLLTALRHCGSTASANAFTGAEARRRIQAIMRPPARPGRAVTAATNLLAMCVAVTAATSAIAAASQPQALIAPRIIAELTTPPNFPGANVGGRAEIALAEERERLSTAEARLAELPEGSPAHESLAREVEAFRTAVAERDAALQTAPQGPIAYARPPGMRSEALIQILCTLNAEGRATGCAGAEPAREPERTVQAIAEIEARNWPVGTQVIPTPRAGLQTSPGEPEKRNAIVTTATRITTRPGPMTVWLQPDGKVYGGGATRVEFLIGEAPNWQTQNQVLTDYVRNRATQTAKALTDQHNRTPIPLKDEAGRIVGQAVRRAMPFGEPEIGGGFILHGPVMLHVDGRPVGELATSAERGLTFAGRALIDRSSPVPVVDRDGVLHARRNLADLRPGEKSLLRFAPIMEAEPEPGPQARASIGDEAMKLTRYFQVRPQSNPAGAPALQPASFQRPAWPSGRAAPRQRPIYEAVDFRFDVDFGEGARWTTEKRVRRGERGEQIRLPSPPTPGLGPFNVMAELTERGEPRLHMLRADGRAIDGGVMILTLNGLPVVAIGRNPEGRDYQIGYSAKPVGSPINGAWIPGEMITTNSAGAVVRRTPCHVAPGAEAGRCRPLPP